MKTFLILVVLAALAFMGLKLLASGAGPRGTLSRVIEAPGVAISKLNFSGGSPVTLVIVIGGALLVLLVLYLVLVK